MDAITFTITLPAGGMFDDQIHALQTARDAQQRAGNIAAAQSLHMILTLAKRGLLAFNSDTMPPTIQPGIDEHLPARAADT